MASYVCNHIVTKIVCSSLLVNIMFLIVVNSSSNRHCNQLPADCSVQVSINPLKKVTKVLGLADMKTDTVRVTTALSLGSVSPKCEWKLFRFDLVRTIGVGKLVLQIKRKSKKLSILPFFNFFESMGFYASPKFAGMLTNSLFLQLPVTIFWWDSALLWILLLNVVLTHT